MTPTQAAMKIEKLLEKLSPEKKLAVLAFVTKSIEVEITKPAE